MSKSGPALILIGLYETLRHFSPGPVWYLGPLLVLVGLVWVYLGRIVSGKK